MRSRAIEFNIIYNMIYFVYTNNIVLAFGDTRACRGHILLETYSQRLTKIPTSNEDCENILEFISA